MSVLQENWKKNRYNLEKKHFKIKGKSTHIFSKIINSSKDIIRVLPKSIVKKGVLKTKKLKLEKLNLNFQNLPLNFDGVRILHMSDFHFDMLEDMWKEIARLTSGHYDFIFFTGDYIDNFKGNFDCIKFNIDKILSNISHTKSFFTLGNHDSIEMAEFLVECGYNVLCNKSERITINKESILITGLDDVFRFYTKDILKEIVSENIFKIALVHSPCASGLMSKDYDLYLCGHTHAGQIILSKNIASVSELVHKTPKNKVYHLWQEGKMVGYTTAGVGVSLIPIRVNCPGEICEIILKRESKKILGVTT